jgi:hypothetical protein
MHCGFLLSSDPHHMLMLMMRVLMATMRILLQPVVVMVTQFVIGVLFPLAPNEFLFSRMMDWVSLSFPFPDLRVVLMLKSISHGS